MEWTEHFDFYLTSIQKIGVRYLIATVLSFVTFYILFSKFFTRRKIQKIFPKNKDYIRDATFSVMSILIFGVVSVLTFKILKPYSFIYFDMDEYGVPYYIFTFVILFFFHDAYFYLVHRMMHWPALFKTIHLVHHKSTNPSPWTAYAFHPLEAILEVMVIPMMTFIMPVHFTVIGFLMLFQIFFNVYAHLGYELFYKGFHKTWVGRYVNTSVAHNLHHHKFEGNFGLYTLIWDRVFGTIRSDYDETYESVGE